MQSKKIARPIARLTVAALGAAVLAPAAFAADCSSKDVETIGQTAASLVRAQVEPVVAIAGKEMINLSSCRPRGASFDIEYKYNFMGPDGYYWVEGEGRIEAGGTTGSVTLVKLSDKLKDAAAAKNLTLASR